MIAAIGGPTVALITLVILVAGTTNGLAGFGFALVGTMALATVIDPATAVVFIDTTARKPTPSGVGGSAFACLHYCRCRWQADSPTELY